MPGPLDLGPPYRRTPAAWIDDVIPVFHPRTAAERQADPYDRDSAVADIYTGIAFAHRLTQSGEAEALYRTLAALVLAQHQTARQVLDAGTGVGRLVWECAPAMPQAHFHAIDLAYENCRRAHAITKRTDPIPLPTWNHRGRPGLVFQDARSLPNATIAQASLLDLPFENQAFDLAVAALVLCRVKQPLRALGELTRILKPGGQLILATPFGFRLEDEWKEAGPASLRAALDAYGFTIHDWFHHLPYREILDAQGNAAEWRVTVITATR